MDIQQILLALFTLPSMFCTQQRPGHPLLKWACILGLLSQPFWFWSSISAGQYGIVAVNVGATLIWFRGLWTFWIEPRRHRRSPVKTIVLVQGVTDESRPRNH